MKKFTKILLCGMFTLILLIVILNADTALSPISGLEGKIATDVSVSPGVTYNYVGNNWEDGLMINLEGSSPSVEIGGIPFKHMLPSSDPNKKNFIQVSPSGNIDSANINVDSTGGEFTINGERFIAPPNSKILYISDPRTLLIDVPVDSVLTSPPSAKISSAPPAIYRVQGNGNFLGVNIFSESESYVIFGDDNPPTLDVPVIRIKGKSIAVSSVSETGTPIVWFGEGSSITKNKYLAVQAYGIGGNVNINQRGTVFSDLEITGAGDFTVDNGRGRVKESNNRCLGLPASSNLLTPPQPFTGADVRVTCGGDGRAYNMVAETWDVISEDGNVEMVAQPKGCCYDEDPERDPYRKIYPQFTQTQCSGKVEGGRWSENCKFQ